MRALTFAAVGAIVGLVIACVLGAGAIVIFRGSSSFTPSALFAMGHRIKEITPLFLTAGIILGGLGSLVNARNPEDGTPYQVVLKRLGLHLFIPVAAFLILYIVGKDPVASTACFVFAMLGSMVFHMHRSQPKQRLWNDAEIPSKELDDDGVAVIWHPAWTGSD